MGDKSIMKRLTGILALVAPALVLIGLSGCAEDNEKEAGLTSTPAPPGTTPQSYEDVEKGYKADVETSSKQKYR